MEYRLHLFTALVELRGQKWKKMELLNFEAYIVDKNKRYKSSGSSSDMVKEKASASSTSSASGNEDVLARLMVNEYVNLTTPYKERKSHNVEAFSEIRKKELQLRE
ncbi:hypothetical protein Tco_0217146 [Tanacetum coccineum]